MKKNTPFLLLIATSCSIWTFPALSSGRQCNQSKCKDSLTEISPQQNANSSSFNAIESGKGSSLAASSAYSVSQKESKPLPTTSFSSNPSSSTSPSPSASNKGNERALTTPLPTSTPTYMDMASPAVNEAKTGTSTEKTAPESTTSPATDNVNKTSATTTATSRSTAEVTVNAPKVNASKGSSLIEMLKAMINFPLNMAQRILPTSLTKSSSAAPATGEHSQIPGSQFDPSTVVEE